MLCVGPQRLGKLVAYTALREFPLSTGKCQPWSLESDAGSLGGRLQGLLSSSAVSPVPAAGDQGRQLLRPQRVV